MTMLPIKTITMNITIFHWEFFGNTWIIMTSFAPISIQVLWRKL